MTEPRPISSTRDTDVGAFDVLFERSRERLVRICTGFIGADAGVFKDRRRPSTSIAHQPSVLMPWSAGGFLHAQGQRDPA